MYSVSSRQTLVYATSHQLHFFRTAAQDCSLCGSPNPRYFPTHVRLCLSLRPFEYFVWLPGDPTASPRPRVSGFDARVVRCATVALCQMPPSPWVCIILNGAPTSAGAMRERRHHTSCLSAAQEVHTATSFAAKSLARSFWNAFCFARASRTNIPLLKALLLVDCGDLSRHLQL